jgi:ABC-type multidrug transport system fused ATPase/permease subunit
VAGLPGPLAALGQVIASVPPELRLLTVAAIIFATILLKAVVLGANAIIVAWVDGRAGHDIRCALSRQLLNVGYGFHIGSDPARLVTILGTEAWRASDAIRTIFSMVAAAGAVAVFGLILVAVEWRLALAVLVGVLAIRAAQSVAASRLGALSQRVAEGNRRLSTKMLLNVDAARLIRVFGQEGHEARRFEAASNEVRRAMLTVETASAPLAPAIEVLHAALFIAILLGAQMTGIAVPVIVGFLVLLYRMQPHLRRLSQARLDLAASRGSIAEVEWLLEPCDKPPPPSGRLPFERLTGPIVFEEVGFAYANRPDAGPALFGLSFRLLPNRATALIGPSGAGKTTVVNLLCRLLDPTSGRIIVDGVDLKEIDPFPWRSRIGLAGQDIELIDGTVAENIAYGHAQATFKQIAEAAGLADAHGFIDALPDGYATRVGSRGLSLSGGQRQRIGLARALVRNPEILILDEAMSAVDWMSETAIVSLLRGRLKGTTVIIISHRASTLACCEEGVVIEAGRLLEAGPLNRLRAYQRMVAGRPG